MAAVANVYMGTSEFAAEVLSALAASPHRPRLVVTPPDRGRGRGRKLSPAPCAARAAELGLALHKTESVNLPDSIDAIRASGAELGTVCAFGQLIKAPLLEELPMLNVHPSLLPRWRGAAPVERAIMAGDERTGVAVMRLTEGLDAGPVAAVREVGIAADDDYGSLAPRLASLGGEMLVEALDAHAAGSLRFTEQPGEGVTYAEKIERDERRLDPSRSARELELIARALTPHIGVYLELPGGERLGVAGVRAAPGEAAVGALSAAAGAGALVLGCAEGVLEIARVKPPGGREMAAGDYLRGHEPPAHTA